MFVLSRRKNESIVINDDITVTVVQVVGDKVRLGIEAPKHASVHRGEVHDAIHGVMDLTKVASGETLDHETTSLDVLDRLAKGLSDKSNSHVNREMVLEAILEGVAALEENLNGATSLEELKQFLLRRRH